MTDEEAQLLYEIYAQRAKQTPERSKALPQHAYGDPAKSVKFERERGDYMDRIKELLREWASFHIDKRHGYPSQAAFATERVDGSNRSTDTFREMPAEVVKINGEIERLAPGFKRIIALEYLDRRPQKTKAALLGIPRQVFSQRLLWIHEQLNFTMWGR
jgi:hypothetical protein